MDKQAPMSQGSICTVQSQVVQILQNVEPSSRRLVQETIDSIETTVRESILETLKTSVDESMLRQFKALNLGAYEQILAMFGFTDSSDGSSIEIDRSAGAITDFCTLQSRLMNLVRTLPTDQQAMLLRTIGQLTSALKPQVPQIVTEILIDNRTNLQNIFQSNPMVAAQFEGLINQYASTGLLSAFGK